MECISNHFLQSLMTHACFLRMERGKSLQEYARTPTIRLAVLAGSLLHFVEQQFPATRYFRELSEVKNRKAPSFAVYPISAMRNNPAPKPKYSHYRPRVKSTFPNRSLQLRKPHPLVREAVVARFLVSESSESRYSMAMEDRLQISFGDHDEIRFQPSHVGMFTAFAHGSPKASPVFAPSHAAQARQRPATTGASCHGPVDLHTGA